MLHKLLPEKHQGTRSTRRQRQESPNQRHRPRHHPRRRSRPQPNQHLPRQPQPTHQRARRPGRPMPMGQLRPLPAHHTTTQRMRMPPMPHLGRSNPERGRSLSAGGNHEHRRPRPAPRPTPRPSSRSPTCRREFLPLTRTPGYMDACALRAWASPSLPGLTFEEATKGVRDGHQVV
jgi:hypothetical protein